MKNLSVVCLVAILLVASVSSADIRFHGNGSWDMLEGVGQPEGWQSAAAPGTGDNVRANWGNNTVTLNYTTAVNRMQLGVDESGTFRIQDGGSLTLSAGSTVGNNGGAGVVGALIIDGGGTVQINNWMKIANKATGEVTVNGVLGMTGHLWMGPHGTEAMTGTLNINNGGVVNVGGNVGLGTVNAVDPGAGVGIINVNDGGLLNLHHWNDTGSIQAGSVLNIFGSGVVTVGGNRVDAAYAYEDLGKIVGGLGEISAIFDGGADLTTITNVPEPATMLLLGLGGMLLRKRRLS